MFHRLLIYRKFSTRVYSKGAGVFGALGHGFDFSDYNAYTRIQSLDAYSVKRITIAMGHSAIVLENGELLLIGRPYEVDNLLRINRLRILSPALARFVNRTSASSLFGDLLLEPHKVNIDEPVNTIKSIGGLNIILTEYGRVYNLGSNRWESTTLTFNRTGMNAEEMTKTPQLINLPASLIISVDVGLQHCIACDSEGRVYTWGAGERGQLGDGRSMTDMNPVSIILPKNEKAIDVRAGFHHSCALTENGLLFVWGKFMSIIPKNAKLATVKLFEDQVVPREIKLPENRKIKEICACSVTIVMRADDDSLWVIGMAEYDKNFHNKPIQVYQYSRRHLESETTEEFSEPVILPIDAKLKRGHTRVSVIYPKIAIRNQRYHLPKSYEQVISEPVKGKNDFTIKDINEIYDIVLTEGKAFLVPVKDLFFTNRNKDSITLNENSKVSVDDYSFGWQHSMIVLKDDE